MGNVARTRGRTAVRAGIAATAAAILFASCAPPPTGSTPTTTFSPNGDNRPVVQSFIVKGTIRSAPSVVTLAWSVTDADGDPLTCQLDGDGDGVFELTISDCQGVGSRNVSLPSAGSRTAVLRVDDGNTAPVTATRSYSVATGTTEPFDVELRGLDSLAPSVAAAFTQSLDRWEGIITRGLPDYAPAPRPSCLPADVDPLPPLIDDLIVDVSVVPIDGPGGVLGQAGPTCVLSMTELGFHGVMQFDSADVAVMMANDTFVDVVTHELAHVLGLGTLWDMSFAPWGTRRMLSGAGTSNPTFTGPAAVAELNALGMSGNVPVENTGGAGTRDSHWREVTFGNELMTGYISYSGNPLSRLSIASMADLGYRVDLGAADSYSLPGSALLRRLLEPTVEGEMLRPPVGLG
jgi:hypothetical protein